MGLCPSLQVSCGEAIDVQPVHEFDAYIAYQLSAMKLNGLRYMACRACCAAYQDVEFHDAVSGGGFVCRAGKNYILRNCFSTLPVLSKWELPQA